MGCVQAKAAAPGHPAPAHLPSLLSTRAGHQLAKAGHGLSKAGHGAADALKAVGHQAGHGAADALMAVGHGAHEAALAARDLGRLHKEEEERSVADPVVETSWYAQLLEGVWSLDPWACCQPAVGGSNLLGALVKGLLETFDASALGVEVEVGALVIDATTGRIELEGLTVFNPEGYRSAHLLHADQVVVDIDVERLLFSFGKELHVEELLFDGVEVVYEQGLHGSNVHDLLGRLEAAQTSAAPAEAGGTTGVAGGGAAAAREPEGPAAASDVKLVLHAILAQRVGAKVCTKLTRGHGLRLEVGTVQYADFDKEMGPGRGFTDVIRVLVSTLLKSVLATVVGRDREQAIVGAAHAATRTLKSRLAGGLAREA